MHALKSKKIYRVINMISPCDQDTRTVGVIQEKFKRKLINVQRIGEHNKKPCIACYPTKGVAIAITSPLVNEQVIT